jgi:hypothetical protein
MTGSGGRYNNGAVYKLCPDKKGDWKLTVIEDFEYGLGGTAPAYGPIRDAAGNLYAGTDWGGASDWGTVFELTHESKGKWAITILLSFNGQEGRAANELVFGKDRNLYGTTVEGGDGCWWNAGCGVVFELTP